MAIRRTRVNDDVASYIAQWSLQQELCQLCLTSRTMHAIACPLLYRTLSTQIGSAECRGILRSLRSNPALARHVRSLCADNNYAADDDLVAFLTLLPNLTSLEFLSWSGYEALVEPDGLAVAQGFHLHSLAICYWDGVVDSLLALIPPIKRLSITQFFSPPETTTAGLEQLLLRSVRSLEYLEIDADALETVVAAHGNIVWPNVRELAAVWNERMPEAFPNVRCLLEFPCSRIDQIATLSTDAWPGLEFVSVWIPRSSAHAPARDRPRERRVVGLEMYPIGGQQADAEPVTLQRSVLAVLDCFSKDHLSSLVLTVQELWNIDILPVAVGACRGLQYLGVRALYLAMLDPLLTCLASLDAHARLRCICIDAEKAVETYGEYVVLCAVEAAVSPLALRYPALKVIELKRASRRPWAGSFYYVLMRWRISRDAHGGVQLSLEHFADAARYDTFSIFDLMLSDPKRLYDVQMLQ